MNYNRPEQIYREAGESIASSGKTRGSRNRRWVFFAADILLLIAILAAIFFLVLLLTPLDLFAGSGVEQREVLYTVELAGIDRDSVEALHIGDVVTDAATGSVIGVVEAVDSRPYEVYTDIPTQEIDEELNSHVVTKNTYPDNFNTVTVTIRVTADYTPGVGYTAEECRIAVGRSYELHFPEYAANCVCVTFTEEGGAE